MYLTVKGAPGAAVSAVLTGPGVLGAATQSGTTDEFGELRLTSRGFGIVRLGERDIPDIVVPPENLSSALDGDQVLVYRGMHRRKGQLVPEKHGEVVRVLRRRRPTLVGRFVPDPVQPWVDPYARRLNMRVVLDSIPDELPLPGEFVEVAVGETTPDQVRPRTVAA